MYKILGLIAVVILPATLFSQLKDATTFGKIDKAELLNTNCSYDKGAEAEVLSDVGRFSVEFTGEHVFETLSRQVRVKILNDKGLDAGDVRLLYADTRDREQISNISAATYNLDEAGNMTATKLEKNLIYDKRVNANQSEKVFTMPNVKVGSIIEYKYTINNSGRRNWYLQRSIPVRYSHFTVDVPEEIEIYLRPFCNRPYESKDLSQYHHTIKTFCTNNIPGLHHEDFMSCEDDYLQKIEVWPVAYTIEGLRHPLLKTWTEETQDLLADESFGTQLHKSIPRTDDLDQALKTLTDPYQKMNAIYNYVRSNMTWDSRRSIYSTSGVRSAWKDKNGSSGDINLILVNLLKDAGLDVHPMLASTHDNGLVTTSSPDFSQFNEVLALVKINNRQYVLDGTDKYTPAGLIPEDILTTECLLVDETDINKYKWVELWDPARMEKDVVAYQAEISEDGQMEGHVSIRSVDYSRINRAKVFTHAKDEYVSKYCVSLQQGLKVDNLEVQDVNTDSVPLIQRFNFHAPVTRSGEYSYFSANLFSGMPGNPFIADNRSSDVFFGANQSRTIVATISIPDGYEFEDLPKNVSITLEDKSLVVTRLVAAANGSLNTRITLEYRRPFYTAAEYPMLKEFYKKMYSLLDEQFVIKKKA